MHRELERFEPTRVLQELLEERGPRDSQEWRYASVAHEVRHVRVPITTARVFNINREFKLRTMGEREEDSRASYFVCKRERTLDRREVEQMDRYDEVLAECCHALCPQ